MRATVAGVWPALGVGVATVSLLDRLIVLWERPTADQSRNPPTKGWSETEGGGHVWTCDCTVSSKPSRKSE